MSWQEFDIQPKAAQILSRSVANDRVGHAYLFSGLNGTGKLEAAIRFAMSVNCEEHSDGEHCSHCPSCDQIWRGMTPEENNHPDLKHLVPGEWEKQKSYTIVINAIRALTSSLQSSPLKAKRRFCIIHDADTMNEDAQNAFLKTLEEPLEGLRTTFIMLTTKPKKLLPTIRSRCQEITFMRISREKIAATLMEEFKIQPTNASVLAALSDGSLGKAREMAQGDIIEERNNWIKIIGHVYKRDSGIALQAAEEIGRDKLIIKRFLEFALLWHRDMLLVKEGDNARQVVNVDAINELESQTSILSVAQIIGQMEKIQELLGFQSVHIRNDLGLLDLFAPVLISRR